MDPNEERSIRQRISATLGGVNDWANNKQLEIENTTPLPLMRPNDQRRRGGQTAWSPFDNQQPLAQAPNYSRMYNMGYGQDESHQAARPNALLQAIYGQ